MSHPHVKNDIGDIDPNQNIEEDPDSYSISFKFLEKKRNRATNRMLQVLKKINEGDTAGKYKYIVKGTPNKAYEALYENLEKKGIMKDKVWEIVLPEDERIFFSPMRIENKIIIAVVKMTTKHFDTEDKPKNIFKRIYSWFIDIHKNSTYKYLNIP